MIDALSLTAGELGEVRRVLSRHLPEGILVWVFGSRSGGVPKPWSDLDLALVGHGPLSLDLLAELAEAFDESALPFKVDLVDRKSVSDAFGAIIDARKIELPL